MTVTGKYTALCDCGRRVTRHVEAASEWFAGRRGIHIRCLECGHISFTTTQIHEESDETPPRYSPPWLVDEEAAIRFTRGESA